MASALQGVLGTPRIWERSVEQAAINAGTRSSPPPLQQQLHSSWISLSHLSSAACVSGASRKLFLRASSPGGMRSLRLRIVAAAGSKKLENSKLRVAVIGGGPAGGCAVETLAKNGIETFLIERKMDNAKPCGGAVRRGDSAVHGGRVRPSAVTPQH